MNAVLAGEVVGGTVPGRLAARIVAVAEINPVRAGDGELAPSGRVSVGQDGVREVMPAVAVRDKHDQRRCLAVHGLLARVIEADLRTGVHQGIGDGFGLLMTGYAPAPLVETERNIGILRLGCSEECG